MIIFWNKDDSNNKKLSLNKDNKIVLNNLREYNNLEDETKAIKITISKSENLCENYEMQSFISNESFIELFKDSESTEFESFSNNNLKKKIKIY